MAETYRNAWEILPDSNGAPSLGETAESLQIAVETPDIAHVHTDSTTPPPASSWRERRLLGITLRAVLALAPTVVAGTVVISLMGRIPADANLFQGVGWLLAIAVAGFLAATITARFATRMLPLAALLKLSLVFPDEAPSRFRLAIKSASSRRLSKQVKEARRTGLSGDSTTAAEQILLLTTAVGEHDRRTRGHSERVRVFSRLIGEELGLDEVELEKMQWGALLHDIGKLSVPAAILNKSKTLTATEWAILEGHPAAGRQLIEPVEAFLGDFASTADGHHEKWDGTGYPAGLAGEDIPLAARIVAVADAFEVMTSVRAYKQPMSSDAARAELTRCAGTHFDPNVVRALLNVSIGPIRWATGPVALAMSLPLVGHLFGLLARAGFHIGGSPAAAASVAPVTATAGALTVAAVTGSIPMPQTLAMTEQTTIEVESDIVYGVRTTTTANPTSTTATSSTTIATTTTTTPPPTEAPTAAPSTDAPTTTTPTTTAAPTTPPTTAAPSTTAPSTTTTAPPTTTTTTAPPTTTTPAPLLTSIQGDSADVLGPIAAGADLSSSGSYVADDKGFLFVDPVVTLDADLTVGGRTIAAGTTVCPHYFVYTPTGDGGRLNWRIDFSRPILAIAGSAADLAATDTFSANGLTFNTNRAVDPNDGVDVDYRDGDIDLDFQANSGRTDSLRIFVACD